MPGIFGHKLTIRLLALTILTFCLILVSRSGGGSSLGPSAETSAAPAQTQEPTITVEVQADAPLAITSVASAGRMAPDSQFVEFGFYVINVSPKPIRAYAIRQEISASGTKLGGGVALYNPQLANSVLRPNQSTFIGDTSTVTSGKKNIITLAVDFVEFSDGTKWGADSVRSSERAAGQRAGAYIVSQRLLQVLNTGKAEDVMHAIEDGTANTEPPADRSQEWKEGFRGARVAVLNRLKRIKEDRGLRELERELRRLGETFKGKD
jgi:hypothetical protein